jgi:hypothetical protein
VKRITAKASASNQKVSEMDSRRDHQRHGGAIADGLQIQTPPGFLRNPARNSQTPFHHFA